MQNGSTIRILVVDHYKPWQDFVCSKIGTAQGMQVTGRTSDGKAAVQKARELQPNLMSRFAQPIHATTSMFHRKLLNPSKYA